MFTRMGIIRILPGMLWLAVLAGGCGGPGGSAGEGAKPSTAEMSPRDKPLAEYRKNLLGIGFEAVTAMPVDPHIKDRSRAQAAVFDACLQLDQPVRALGCAEKIANWRRGECYAAYALYCVQQGKTGPVQHYLDEAQKISLAADDWRRDRIKVRVAYVHALMGNREQAEKLQANVEDSETGKLGGILGAQDGAEQFQAQLAAIDEATASGNFDILRNLLESTVRLFDYYYTTNPGRRDRVASRIKSSWKSIPIFVRVDLLLEMAQIAARHEDKAKSGELVDEAQAMVEGANWPADYHVPLLARLARGRVKAGQTDKALAILKDSLSLFDKYREKMLDIDRAGALRPVAEAYEAAGDTAAALAVFKRAIEAGYENINSRPRAEDLSATCCSMAVSGVEPDAELWKRIRQIREGLGEPW